VFFLHPLHRVALVWPHIVRVLVEFSILWAIFIVVFMIVFVWLKWPRDDR
jgi:hypothetical protein